MRLGNTVHGHAIKDGFGGDYGKEVARNANGHGRIVLGLTTWSENA